MSLGFFEKVNLIRGAADPDPRVELVVDAKADLGEGTLWDDKRQVLWWVDILNNKLYQHDPATQANKEFDIGSVIGTVGLADNDHLIVATFDGIGLFDPETGSVSYIINPEADLPQNRFNDGKPGPNGSFYAGTMGFEGEKEAGSLYRLDPNGEVEKIIPNVTISNGLAWNKVEDTMFYIDTPTKEVWAFDYDKSTGAISNKRVAVNIPWWAGNPDGMTIDSDDHLWVAHWGGSAVHCWDPKTGRHLDTISMPAAQITCCAFGGVNLDTLYISSARIGLSEDKLKQRPHSGGLFKVNVGKTGRKAYRFKG
ncbi:MAG: SMP-30/gluconolactonase/LRE family protein [Chloroflexota bacterium]